MTMATQLAFVLMAAPGSDLFFGFQAKFSFDLLALLS
jgi:hypothetical protein